MPESPLRQVSDTAYWIAAYRAAEGARRDALFHDPLAERLAGEHGREIARRMGNPALLAWSTAIRTVIVDGLVGESLADGADTVLCLGAGLDTRPYRLALPAGLRWIEVDFPHLIACKAGLLAQERPHCRLERIGLDLTDAPARAALLRDVDAGGGNVLVLTEGVVPYLSVEEVGPLADDLAACPHLRHWIVDYFSPLFMESYRSGPSPHGMGPDVAFRFDPPDWTGFFRAHGWELQVMRFHHQVGLRLGRPAPMPWHYRLLRGIIPRAKREHIERMIGFALLERPDAEETGN